VININDYRYFRLCVILVYKVHVDKFNSQIQKHVVIICSGTIESYVVM